MTRSGSMRLVVLLASLCSGVGVVAQTRAQSPTYNDLIAKARTLLADRKPQEAIEQSEAAIKLDDKRWEAYVTAASGYSAQKLYDDAIGMLQMALPRAPTERKQLVRDAITEARQLSSGGAVANAGGGGPQPSGGSSAGSPTQAEVVLWKTIENSTRVEDFRGYIERYPNGTYASVAASRIARLDADNAIAAKATAAENERKRLEAEKQAENQKYTFPVAHLHARLTFSGNPGCYGHLRITPDGISYEGEEGNVVFSKTSITYIDLANTGAGSFLRFHTSNAAWAFTAIDEADVQNRKFNGGYPPGKLGDAVVQRWGWVSADKNKKLVPAGQ